MSILESMRSGTDSTFMQVILALVVVSFVFWYAKPQADVTSEAANVHGTRIMGTQVDRELRISLGGMSPRSDEEWAQYRSQVTRNLVDRELLYQYGIKAGLQYDVDAETGLSRTIALRRRENPMFVDESGQFDEELYRQGLRQMQFTPDEFDARLQKDVVYQKFAALMSYGVIVPDQMLRDAYIQQETKARVEYVRLRPANFNDQVDTSEAAIAAWLEANPGSARASYDASLAEYELPETIEVQMIALRLTGDGQGAADLRPRLVTMRESILAAADAKAEMADLARKWSEHITAEDGGDLGSRAVSEVSDEVLAGIEGLEPGDVSDVIFTDNLAAIYRLGARTEARTQPYEEVEADIASRLMLESETPGLAATFAEELRAEWARTGQVPESRLTELGLMVQTSEYRNMASQPSALAPPDQLIKEALGREPGDVLSQVFQAGETLFVAAVDDIEEADLSAFEDDRASIRRAVLRERRGEFITDWLEDARREAGL